MNDTELYANIELLRVPEYGEWECYMFGSHKGHGICWRPLKGQEPNWFWRYMQWLCFGHHWVKRK